MENKKTQVHAYRGIVFINSAFDAPGFVNNPKDPGQMGCIVKTSEIDISPEALRIIQTYKNSADDLGVLDVLHNDENGTMLAWLGGPKTIIGPEEMEAGANDTDYSKLKASEDVEYEIPEGLEEILDKHLDKEPEE